MRGTVFLGRCTAFSGGQTEAQTIKLGHIRVAMNLLVTETVKQLIALGVDSPLWMSANLPGGDEANRAFEEKYIPLIKHLG